MNNFVELLDLRMKDGANLLKRVVELPQGAQGFYGIVYDKSQTTTLRIEAEKWQNIVKETLISYFGEHDRHVADFVRKIYNKDSFFDFKEDLSRELRDNISYLDTLKESIKEGLITFSSSIQEDENRRHNNTKKVFIVHGHDESARKDAELLMKDLGFEPIVLFKRPNMGDTIIEKLERESIDVCFAIVLYTSCDLGKAKEESELHPRARQNVVFEHGMMCALLGRKRVVALLECGVEKPGDISGVVYIPLDEAGNWRYKVVREMRAIGLDADMNRIDKIV